MKDVVDEDEGGWCVALGVQVAKMVVRGAATSRERERLNWNGEGVGYWVSGLLKAEIGERK